MEPRDYSHGRLLYRVSTDGATINYLSIGRGPAILGDPRRPFYGRRLRRLRGRVSGAVYGPYHPGRLDRWVHPDGLDIRLRERQRVRDLAMPIVRTLFANPTAPEWIHTYDVAWDDPVNAPIQERRVDA